MGTDCADHSEDDREEHRVSSGSGGSGGSGGVDARLLKACRKGNSELCAMLLRRGGDVARADCGGNTCLHVAVREGHLDVVHLLCSVGSWRARRQGECDRDRGIDRDRDRDIDRDRDRDRDESKDGSESDDEREEQASKGSGSGRFKCLSDCQQSALIARNDKGETALFVACRLGFEDLVRYLSQRMTTRAVNMLDNFGRSPLWMAARNGCSEIVRALYAMGADLEQLNRHGESPLWTAASQGHLQTVRTLCDLQCEVDARSNDRTTPLGAALEAGHMEVVDLLVTYGATAWQNASLLSSSKSAAKLLAHTMPCPPSAPPERMSDRSRRK